MRTYAVPDCFHNWLVDYLSSRTHQTTISENKSTFLTINASIIQGSGLGPVCTDTRVNRQMKLEYRNSCRILSTYSPRTAVESINQRSIASDTEQQSPFTADAVNIDIPQPLWYLTLNGEVLSATNNRRLYHNSCGTRQLKKKSAMINDRKHNRQCTR